MTQLQRLIEPGQFGTINREYGHAGEPTGLVEQLAGKLNGGLAADACDYRPADKQVVMRRIDLSLEMRAVGDADTRRKRPCACKHQARCIRHSDLCRHRVKECLRPRPVGKIEPIALRGPQRSGTQQDRIDLANRASRTFFECLGQIAGGSDSGVFCSLIFVIKGECDACPEQRQKTADCANLWNK